TGVHRGTVEGAVASVAGVGGREVGGGQRGRFSTRLALVDVGDLVIDIFGVAVATLAVGDALNVHRGHHGRLAVDEPPGHVNDRLEVEVRKIRGSGGGGKLLHHAARAVAVPGGEHPAQVDVVVFDALREERLRFRHVDVVVV